MYYSGVPVILSYFPPDLVLSSYGIDHAGLSCVSLLSLSCLAKNIIHSPTKVCMKGAIEVEKAVTHSAFWMCLWEELHLTKEVVTAPQHTNLLGLTDLVSFPCAPTPALNSLVTNCTWQREQSRGAWGTSSHSSSIVCVQYICSKACGTLWVVEVESHLAQNHVLLLFNRCTDNQ